MDMQAHVHAHVHMQVQDLKPLNCFGDTVLEQSRWDTCLNCRRINYKAKADHLQKATPFHIVNVKEWLENCNDQSGKAAGQLHSDW